jgi:hypothetical protein
MGKGGVVSAAQAQALAPPADEPREGSAIEVGAGADGAAASAAEGPASDAAPTQHAEAQRRPECCVPFPPLGGRTSRLFFALQNGTFGAYLYAFRNVPNGHVMAVTRVALGVRTMVLSLFGVPVRIRLSHMTAEAPSKGVRGVGQLKGTTNKVADEA